MAAWSNRHNIFDAYTIEFPKPLQENNNLALKAFIKKLRISTFKLIIPFQKIEALLKGKYIPNSVYNDRNVEFLHRK